MGKPLCKPAAMNFGIGALEKALKKLTKELQQQSPDAEPIPPSTYDVGGVELTMRFPALATVSRAQGSDEKPGYTESPAAPIQVSLCAVLRYLQRCRDEKLPLEGNKAIKVWEEVIREDLARLDEGYPVFPLEALTALSEVRATAPAGASKWTKTPTKRTGDDEVDITIKRLPKAKK